MKIFTHHHMICLMKYQSGGRHGKIVQGNVESSEIESGKIKFDLEI